MIANCESCFDPLPTLPGLIRYLASARAQSGHSVSSLWPLKWKSPISGTWQPAASSRSRIGATAAAASSLLTVMRTSSEPAAASAATWATVAATSAVSVLVIDCTTIGAPPPMATLPTRAVRVRWRALGRCSGLLMLRLISSGAVARRSGACSAKDRPACRDKPGSPRARCRSRCRTGRRREAIARCRPEPGARSAPVRRGRGSRSRTVRGSAAAAVRLARRRAGGGVSAAVEARAPGAVSVSGATGGDSGALAGSAATGLGSSVLLEVVAAGTAAAGGTGRGASVGAASPPRYHS